MLSYQHSFHAGNHADVIKHITLLALIERLLVKPKPFFYLDTHAGSGHYDISQSLSDSQSKHQDFVLAHELSKEVKLGDSKYIDAYLDLIRPFLHANQYPGSPLVSANALALFDKQGTMAADCNMHLSELHPQAFTELRSNMRGKGFRLHQRDGFELMNALMPPKPNRGLILVDPPYENKSEYQTVVSHVSKALFKWPQAQIAIWYPLLSPTRLDRKSKQVVSMPKHGLSESMIKGLHDIAESSESGLLDIRFSYSSPSVNMGMYGSGMLVLNPPYKIEVEMTKALDTLVKHFANEHSSLSHVQYIVQST